MGDFFKGLRRMVGVLALLLACIFMAGWVRSQIVNDFLATDGKNATYRLGSYGGMLNFIRETPPAEFGRFVHWDSFDEGENNKFELWATWISWKGHDVHWQWDCGQFHFGSGTIMGTGTAKRTRVDSFLFPYWFFVIPLTLISTYLLLSKSCKPNQTKTTASATESVT